MIVWSGRGILAALFLLLFGVGAIWSFPESWANDISFVFAFAVAGLASYFLGTAWNAEKIVFHEKEQQYFRHKNTHTLFWIPMQYIGLLFLVISVVILVQSSVLWGIILGVVLLGIVGFKTWKEKGIAPLEGKAQVVSRNQVQPMEEKEVEEKRQAAYEDPTRFMPK